MHGVAGAPCRTAAGVWIPGAGVRLPSLKLSNANAASISASSQPSVREHMDMGYSGAWISGVTGAISPSEIGLVGLNKSKRVSCVSSIAKASYADYCTGGSQNSDENTLNDKSTQLQLRNCLGLLPVPWGERLRRHGMQIHHVRI